jgi:NADH-quinone oxidoreductase subunit J
MSVEWIKSHWTLLVPLCMGALALAWMMPRQGKPRPIAAGLMGLAAVGCAGFFLLKPGPEMVESALFFLFAGTAIVAAGLMITSHNPVYAALWFALVTLSVCGLFLLQSAPFLSAATIIVYAGAIIVTFVFVIMLARQSGAAFYDQSSEQPTWATFASFLLLGGMLVCLGDWRGQSGSDEGMGGGMLKVPAVWQDRELNPNPLSTLPDSGEPGVKAAGTMRGLGRSLFGDYLFAVEIAGTLLMVATIGSVAIAPRRAQGGL